MTGKERIKYKEEIERIEGLQLETICKMKTTNLWRLTKDFSEPLVRMIFAKTADIDKQRSLVDYLKNAYKNGWDFLKYPSLPPDFPNYLDDFSFEIDCGRIITEDGLSPAPVMISPPPANNRDKPIIVTPWIAKKINNAHSAPPDTPKFQARIEEKEEENEKLQHQLEESQKRIKELETEKEALKQILEQKEFRSTKPEDAILKEEIERQKQKREDMLVELVRPSFLVEADARRFVKEIDNGMDSDGVAEVARRYYLGNKIVKSKRGRSLWEILHAAKLYDKVEQSWTREMRKAD